MGISSLQVCMDSSDWSSLQGAISEVNTGLMDSPPVATPNNDNNNNDILACSRPLIESRRLRPNHEQALKCPRCESTHTKFCYYNNYSLTQPRYFCKTCRRYWTKGGTLRNIPVGGGCRKNKKLSSSSKKPSGSSDQNNNNNNSHRPSSSLVNRNRDINPDPQDFQQLHFSSFNNPGFLFENMIPNPVEFVDSNNGVQNPSGHHHDNYLIGYNNPFGLMSNSFDNPGVGPNDNVLDSCQRLILPNHDYHENYRPNHDYHYNDHQNHRHHEVGDVKPNAKVLSLEWHDCNSDAGIKDSFGYNLGGLGSWTGLMGGYGSSATNPLV